jgi:dTDP-D-glucose 4,6-dehydratase
MIFVKGVILKPEVTFKEGLLKTVSWYCNHLNWWKPLRN